jgi:hypothetical protein
MVSTKELRSIYGKEAVISRKDGFVFVHLDRPSARVVRARTKKFDPDSYFFDDCPLCQMAREGGVIVFDDFDPEEEDVLLE